MFRSKPLAVAVFAMWTLAVWGQRIVNITTKNGGDGVDLARAVAFVVIGLSVAVVAVRHVPAPLARRIVTVGAWASIALWATRLVTIPLGDYSLGFVLVHVVLAVVSIALAWWAMSAAARAADITETTTGRVTPGPDVDDHATTNA